MFELRNKQRGMMHSAGSTHTRTDVMRPSDPKPAAQATPSHS